MKMFQDKNMLLHKNSLALVNFKGGAGKTVLTGNLAAIAARLCKWTTVVVDLDANIPLTRLAFGDLSGIPTVKDALKAVALGGEVGDMFRYAPDLGFFILPGSVAGIDEKLARYIPALIRKIKETYFDGNYVDMTLVDTPGESRLINSAVMAGIDFVAVPLSLVALDMAATLLPIAFIKATQKKRNGLPALLGMIPNRVQRRGTYEKAFLRVALENGTILPYIPDSNVIKGSFVKSGGKAGGKLPVLSAPKATATMRLKHLFEEMNKREKDRAGYVAELCDHLGVDPDEILSKETLAPLEVTSG